LFRHRYLFKPVDRERWGCIDFSQVSSLFNFIAILSNTQFNIGTQFTKSNTYKADFLRNLFEARGPRAVGLHGPHTGGRVVRATSQRCLSACRPVAGRRKHTPTHTLNLSLFHTLSLSLSLSLSRTRDKSTVSFCLQACCR